MKRHKPKSEVRDKTDPASKEDYEKMADLCIGALINREPDVILSFPYFVKFKSKDFPYRLVIDKTLTHNVYKIKARKLLDWLHKNGYSKYTAKDIIFGTLAVTKKVRAMERGILDNIPGLEDNTETPEGEGEDDVVQPDTSSVHDVDSPVRR